MLGSFLLRLLRACLRLANIGWVSSKQMIADTLYSSYRIFKHLLGISGLRSNRLGGAAAHVVTYHGILQRPLSVPDWCFLDARTFEAQIRFLARHFQLVHLEDLFSADVGEAEPAGRPRLAVTFDDGYANNHDVAFPILRKHGVQATIFLVSDLVDSDDTLWFCRLHDAVCKTHLKSVVHDGIEVDLRGPSARAAGSALLQSLLKALPPDALRETCESLVARLGSDWQSTVAADSPYRMLSTAQVRSMANSGLVRFGGHTASHAILGLLDDQGVHKEIESCIQRTSAISGLPCRTFAYPNGRLGDFDARSVEVLQHLGIAISVTTRSGANFPVDDRMYIRRHGIGDGESRFNLALRLARSELFLNHGR